MQDGWTLAEDSLRALKLQRLPKDWIPHKDFPALAYLERSAPRKLPRRTLYHWLLTADAGKALPDLSPAQLRRLVMDGSHWLGDEPNYELCAIIVPWSHPDRELIQSFAQWLKEHRPQGNDDRPAVTRLEPPPTRKQVGAGSEVRQLRKQLKSLAAWRTWHHYGGNRTRAYAHANGYLGKAFSHSNAWSQSKALVQQYLEECRAAPDFLFTDFE